MTRTQPNPDWPTQPPFPTGPGPQLRGPRPGDDDMPVPTPTPWPQPGRHHMQASPSAPTGAVLAVHSGIGALRRLRRPVTPLTPAA